MSFVHDQMYSFRHNPYTGLSLLEDVLPPGQDLPIALGYIAYQTAHAKRGDKMPRLAATTTTWATGVGLWYTTRSLLLRTGLFVPESWPLLLAMGAIGVLTSPLSHQLERTAFRVYRDFTQSDKSIHRLEMGGDFQDSENNWAMRMSAVRDITGALGNTRRFMGQEARFLHQ